MSVEPQVFSPNGDGRLDTATFRFQLNGPARVAICVRGTADARSRSSPARCRGGPQSIAWNGRFRRAVGEREYRADVRATSTVTTATRPCRLAVDRTGPRLQLLSSSPLTFSVNEPADVTVIFDGTERSRAGASSPGRFRIAPGGAFSTFRAVARDFAGNDGRALTALIHSS